MGSLVETYTYDRFHRLKEVKMGNSPGSLQYHYATEAAASGGRWPTNPSKVAIPSGGGFILQHDDTGALEAIVTPRGHSHGFQQLLSLGYYKLRYQAPWALEAYVQHYDQAGRLLARVYPNNSGKVLFTYDSAVHLRAIIGGSTMIHFHYVMGTALVSSIDLVDDNFHMKAFYRYHRGSVKEQQAQFLNSVGLNNYTIEYQYDATGRLATARLDIPNQTELTLLTKFDPRSGRLRAVADLRVVHRSFSLHTMEDLTKSFVREKKFDEYGRFQSLNLIIRSQPLFRVNIEYNANSQIAAKSVFLPHQTTGEEMAYNANNQINIVRSTSPSDGTSWIYTHDVNGNVVSVTEQGQRVTLGYDAGDRVVQFGDLEFVTYDERGFVIRRGEQRYAYNALGQMTSAFEPGKFAVRFYYDAERRLIGSQDHRGSAVQYMYAHPGQPGLVTHIHYPKLGATTQLLYDEAGLLMALETAENRLYVGTDSAGSPLAVFDARGKLVKQVRRTPFGRTMHDSNPGNYDFCTCFNQCCGSRSVRSICFWALLDPDPDALVRGMDPDLSNIKQK
jgi:YD repeat-containing protein